MLNRLLLLAGVLAIILSGINLYQANAGVLRETLMLGPTPVTVFRAANATPTQKLPVVVISHGFAGSQQLMEPFAITLAKNGYLAVSFDYFGHGRNLEPLRGDVTKIDGATRVLVEQTGEVVEYALALPDAAPKLALLGHSMASDIIVRYASEEERVDATIAVSMFSPAVTEDAPKNLLVIVGGLEGFLKEEALRVLALVTDNPRPGETVGTTKDGSARRVAFAPGVEHVGVLYSETSMREASAWLQQTLGGSAGGGVGGGESGGESGYLDHRGPWIMLLLLGLVLIARPLAGLLPTVSSPPKGASLPWKPLLRAALFPAIATPLLLFWFPADFMGMLVGGYLAVHFFVYGLLTLAALWWLRRDDRPTLSATRWPQLGLSAALATAFAAGVIGWVLDSYVTSLTIPAPRAPLFMLMLVGTLSYFLGDEWLAHGEHHARGGHLFTRACFLLSLGIAVALSFEELFFLLIIAGVIVIYFLVYGMFSRWIYTATGHPAAGAIANAVAFAWALTAVFPLMAP